MTATIKDIAARLGISHTTVSRALRGYPYVNEELRQRVRQVADEMNYRPNALARGLKGMRSQLVGLIIPDLLNDFYATAATIIQAELAREGFRLLLSVSGNDPQSEAAYLNAMREERVQGLILVPCSRNERALSEYAAEGVPVIEFTRRSSTSLDAILPDDAGGAQMATEHLLRLGHTRIGIIIGQRALSTTRGRVEGYRRALKVWGLSVDESLIKMARFDRASGRQATEELLDLPTPPTSIFATSNVLLLGALQTLESRKVKIPENISLVGFGNPDWCAVWRPPITTVAFATEEMSILAVKTLLQRMRRSDGRGSTRPTLTRLGCSLLERESTAPQGTHHGRSR